MSILDKIRKNDYDENIRSKEEKKGFETDDRIYQIKDPSKNNSIIGRFIPTGEPIPYLSLYKHKVRTINPDGTENTFKHFCPYEYDGSHCPTCQENFKYFNEENETKKEFYSSLRKQFLIMVNIYIIKDKQNPENNGKVFLFPVNGLKEMKDVFLESVCPSKETREQYSYKPVNVFDIDDGSPVYIEFKSKDETKEKFNKWQMKFEPSEKSPLAKTEKDMIAILDKAYSLSEYKKELSTDKAYYGFKFRPNGEIAEHLKKAFGQISGKTEDYDDDYDDDETYASEIVEEDVVDTTEHKEEPKEENKEKSSNELDDELSDLLD